MPTPLYEMQVFLKKPVDEMRHSKSKAVIWTVFPLCALLLLIGRMPVAATLFAIGFLFMLPGLAGVPGFEITEEGATHLSPRGRNWAAWESLGSFEAGKEPGRAQVPLTGHQAKSLGLGFPEIEGKKYMMVDFPPALRDEAVQRLNEFAALARAGKAFDRGEDAA